MDANNLHCVAYGCCITARFLSLLSSGVRAWHSVPCMAQRLLHDTAFIVCQRGLEDTWKFIVQSASLVLCFTRPLSTIVYQASW
jgi:hypothetical protein